MADKPEHLYFRVRENGATVFRIDTENRQRRIEMDQIAVANSNNGQIKNHPENTPTPAETKAIEAWLATRRSDLDVRQIDDIFRAVDHLNLTTHWAQTKATDEQLEIFTDRLLMAMHDLRSVLVRKKADRMNRD